MKKFAWLGPLLEVSPLFAGILLALLHPLGDPQDSPSFFVRLLDYQGTYWLRNAIPVPPPLLLAGLLVCTLAWWRSGSKIALGGLVAGILMLGFWGLMMLIPLLVHVN
jgi:hypothetical protein